MNKPAKRRTTFVPIERKTIRDYAKLQNHLLNAIRHWHQGSRLASVERAEDLA